MSANIGISESSQSAREALSKRLAEGEELETNILLVVRRAHG